MREQPSLLSLSLPRREGEEEEDGGRRRTGQLLTGRNKKREEYPHNWRSCQGRQLWRQMEVSMPVPVGTMFIRLRSFSKCVPAPRPCALYRRKETRSSGHTRKRMRNTLSRRRTEAHRASSEERDGVFPHICVCRFSLCVQSTGILVVTEFRWGYYLFQYQRETHVTCRGLQL